MTAPTPPAMALVYRSLRAIIRSTFPDYAYAGLFDYRCVTSDGTTVDCAPVDTSRDLPALRGVPIVGPATGGHATPNAGARVVVAFLDRNPTKPVIVGCEVDQVSGGVLSSGNDVLDPASAVGRVVRYGDQITFGTSGSTAPLTFTLATAPCSKAKA